MKKTIPVLLSGIIISFAIISHATAQSFNKSVAIGSPKNNPALVNNIDENNSKENLKALKANLKATESFKKEFKEAPEASWSVIADGIVASFSKDGVKTMVVYNKKGYRIHTLNYFPPEKTPANIRSIVENSYPNADITSSVQVKEGDMEYFVVNLEDKRTIKQVTVYNDETNLLKEYNKGN